MVEKKDVSDPPPYEDLPSATGGNQGSNGPVSPGLPSSSSARFKTLPTPPGSANSAASPSSSWASWTLPWNRVQNEVRENVRSLVRQIVVGIGPAGAADGTPGAAADALEGIMHSCADTCAKHSIAFSSILQDRYIENHSPLYWAIIKQTPSRSSTPFGGDEKTVDVFGILLAYALPLTRQSTISELRLACMSMSNQIAFQRLRLAAPNFSSLSSTDRILLGPSQVLESDVDVTLGSESDGGAFAVDMRFAQFHKRLMVNREVGVEFVVRNRIWKFTLMYMTEDWGQGLKSGTWGAMLSLQDSSSPTWFDGRLILIHPDSAHEHPVASSSQSQGSSPGVHFVRMRSPKDHRLEVASDHRKQIAVSLEDEPAFSSLQYAESYYIPANGVLSVRLEARLTKPSEQPDDECIIC